MRASRKASELEPVLRYLAGRTGLSFPTSRRKDVELGIRTVMAKHGINNADRFVQYVKAHRAAFDALVSEITVGETYFFRELAQSDAIRQIVIPSLLRIRPPDAPIRIWSAGCATGEEAYSIAILMEEEGIGYRTDVLGTDLSAAALKKARKGEYGAWSLRSGRRRRDERYFHGARRRFQVAERIRSRVRFDILNLASADYPSPANDTVGLDLILCRNVLIYLDRNLVEPIAQRLLASLADGGWLVTGPSDPPLWEYAGFATVITPGGVFYRRADRPAPDQMAEPVSQHGLPRAPTRVNIAPASIPRTEARQGRAPAADDRRRRLGSQAQSGADTAASLIRQMANTGPLEAVEQSAAEAVDRYPLSPELHFLHAMVLVGLERHEDAEAALRRVIYIDRTLVAAHLALGSLLQRRGNLAAARRALETAHGLCAGRPASEPVPLTDGDTAGRLAESAQAQMRVLDDSARPER